MCWESTSNFTEEEPHEEPEKVVKKPVEKTEKQRHEEEHVESTLNTGNQINISIKEFCWEKEEDGSTLGTEETEQREIAYITHLENGLRKYGMKVYDEEGPNKKACCEK